MNTERKHLVLLSGGKCCCECGCGTSRFCDDLLPNRLLIWLHWQGNYINSNFVSSYWLRPEHALQWKKSSLLGKIINELDLKRHYMFLAPLHNLQFINAISEPQRLRHQLSRAFKQKQIISHLRYRATGKCRKRARQCRNCFLMSFN